MNINNKNMTRDEQYISDRKEGMIEWLGDAYIHPSEIDEAVATFGVRVTNRIGSDEKDVKIFVDSRLITDCFLDGLNPSILTLMTALITHTDKDGFAYPSIELLSKETGLSDKTIKRLLDAYANVEIKGRTLFYKETKFKDVNRKQNVYYIPNCSVTFPNERDEMTDEDIISGLDRFITCRHVEKEPEHDTEPQTISLSVESTDITANGHINSKTDTWTKHTNIDEEATIMESNVNIFNFNEFLSLVKETEAENIVTVPKSKKDKNAVELKKGKKSEVGMVQASSKKYSGDDTDAFLTMMCQW